jgi:hypothetical protein
MADSDGIHLTHDAIPTLFRPAHHEPRGPAGRRFDGVGLRLARSATGIQYNKFTDQFGG